MWLVIAGIVALVSGVIVRLLLDTSLLIYLGFGLLVSAGVTCLVNAL